MSAPRAVSIPRQLFQLAWPIIGLNVLQVLALAVDTAMIGHTPNSQAALTGMGYASQLIFLLMVGMFGLTTGTVALIARAKGAGDVKRCTQVLTQSVQLTLVLGVVVAIVGNLLAVSMLRLLGADASTLDPALAYFRPLLCGTVFSYLNILLAAALRGVGNTRLAFMVALGLNGLNVVLNYGLILGNYGLPALGNTGAALGTVIAQGCAAVTMAVLLHRRTVPGLYLPFSISAVDRPLCRTLVRVGWPAAADVLVLNAALLSIVGMLGRVDQAAVAAHSIGLRVQSLAFVPGMSISQAIGAMVGQALGAKDLPRAKKVLRAGVWMSAGIMTTLGAGILFASDPIVALFGIDPGSSLHDFSLEWLALLAYGMPVVGVYIALAGLLHGAGATMISLRINAVTTFLLQIPGSYILGFVVGWSTFGIWLTFPAVFAAKGVWAYVAYRKEDWARGDRVK